MWINWTRCEGSINSGPGSLDEKRYCLVCGKIIAGGQILMTGGTRGDGPLRLNCPTERCHSIPMDWILPTDEVMASLALREAERGNASVD